MASTNIYFKNSASKVWCDFSVAGVPTDPDVVTLTTATPGGVLHTYTYPDEISKSSTGKFHIHIILNENGKWKYRWEGSGGCTAVFESGMTVKSDF